MFELLKYTGFIAAITGAITLVPEITRALKTHHLNDVAWSWLIMILMTSCLWLTYGILLHDLALTVAPLANIGLEIALLILKKHYDHHRHPIMHPHLPHCPKKRAPMRAT